MMPASSTIRHVFMFASLCQRVRRLLHLPVSLRGTRSRTTEIQHAIGIKRDENFVVEPEYPGYCGVQRTVKIDRGRVAIAVGQAEHFADAVHQDAKRFRSPLDPDDHWRGGVPWRVELKPICQIDHRDDTTTQIEYTRNFRA